jgi:hypothetical protein
MISFGIGSVSPFSSASTVLVDSIYCVQIQLWRAFNTDSIHDTGKWKV